MDMIKYIFEKIIFIVKIFQMKIIIIHHQAKLFKFFFKLILNCFGFFDLILLAISGERLPYFIWMSKICKGSFPYYNGLMLCDYKRVSDHINNQNSLKGHYIGTMTPSKKTMNENSLIFLNSNKP